MAMGRGFTTTFTEPVAVHIPNTAVTLYCVVTAGAAEGFNTEALLSPVAGDQVKLAAFELLVNIVVAPAQIATSLPAVNVRLLTAEITMGCVARQPLASFTVAV